MNFYNRGITFIELLLVIALLAILGATTSPFLSRFIIDTNFDITLDRIISTIRKAQSYSQTGKNGSFWGVCLTTTPNKIRLYRGGTCNAPTFSEDFDKPAAVTVSAFDTTFSLRRGEPSAALTINITAGTNSGTILVNTAGGMTIN